MLGGGRVVHDADEGLAAVGPSYRSSSSAWVTGRVGRTWQAERMPRVIGTRWGRKSMPAGARVRVRGGGLAQQLLLDLADVAVGEHGVRLDALVDLAEVEVRLGVPAGARHAALGVHDDVRDQPGAREGREREDRGGRVAARRADDRARASCPGPPAPRGAAPAGRRRRRRAARAGDGRSGTRPGSPPASRKRKSGPRSMTVWPRSRNSSIAAGNDAVGERQEHRLRVRRARGRTPAGHASRGAGGCGRSGRPCARGPTRPVIATCGWSASRRISSAPT